MSGPAIHHTIHGASVGILMLHTGFRRLPGDIGHAGTWDFPVLYKVVEQATQERMFSDDPSEGPEALLAPFVAGCEELARLGARGVVTSCGFLAALQPELSERSPIPVASSALMQIPMVQQMIGPNRKVGVITADAEALGPQHFAGVGVTAIPPVAGMPADGILRRDLRGNAQDVDPQGQADELVACGKALLERHPDIGAFVLECTNLAPHAGALQAATHRPVFDIVTLVNWVHGALETRAWPAQSAGL